MSRATILWPGKNETWPETVKRPRLYFEQRHCNVDLRGGFECAGDSHWGYFVTVITRSHGVGEGGFQMRREDRPVDVKSGAWIGSGALLYNCVVGKNSIVAAGAVVKSCEVGPGVIVAGNPAQVVARWNDVRAYWKWEEEKWRILK